MSRENKKSLVLQIQETLQGKLRIGHKKHLDKKQGVEKQHIYSWGTYHAYMQQCCDFIRWCKSAPIREKLGRKPRTLQECRLYAKDYINNSIEKGLSPYTIKLRVAALAKLYGCKAEDFGISTPARKRANIFRSRNVAERDKHFSAKKNADLITFCKCTGLRRAELQQIRGTDLVYKGSKPFLNVTRGTKGGRPRVSPIMGSDEEVAKVIDMLKNAGKNKVFPKVPTHADIHSYRAEYATRIYNAHKRPVNTFKNERLIVHNNRIVDIYCTSGRFPDYVRYAHLYDGTKTDKRTGKPKMLPGYRDVSSVFYCRCDRPSSTKRVGLFYRDTVSCSEWRVCFRNNVATKLHILRRPTQRRNNEESKF